MTSKLTRHWRREVLEVQQYLRLRLARGPSKAMLCVLLLPIAAFLLRAEAAVGIIINNNNNNNDGDTDKWISDKDKYWSKFRDVSVPG
ncbi:hypothetical protein AMELA_G00158060 [Ameiurus melas]|uniref:Uncharacterized protein n=1 Tax=Ameiurus melas TaxID=219545 RepID=A0A7J6ADZ7_AMEME|nr:hypothetical protein AMELA_G00158060 [Ameiurus melas]